MSIITRAEYLTYLDIADEVDTAADGKLNLLHPMAEAAVKHFVGFNIEQKSHTHILPVTRHTSLRDPMIQYWDTHSGRIVAATVGGVIEYSFLQLPELPVRSVEEVREDANAWGGAGDNDFDNATLLVYGQDYFLDVDSVGLSGSVSFSGLLKRIVMYWPSRERTVQVKYTTGFSTAELDSCNSDIKLACLLTLQHMFMRSGKTMETVSSERLGDYSVTYAGKSAELPREAKKMLRPYVSYGRFI